MISPEIIDTIESTGKKRVYLMGLSTDTKPTEHIANASCFYEMDTNKRFYFDEENGLWVGGY